MSDAWSSDAACTWGMADLAANGRWRGLYLQNLLLAETAGH